MVAAFSPQYTPTTKPTAAPTGVSEARFARLTRGVNLTLWFGDAKPQPAQYYQSYITNSDLQLIKKLGFRHVRLAIVPGLLFQENNPQTLNPTLLSYLDKALDLIISNGLAVIVDMHDDAEVTPFKQRVVNNAAFADKFGSFWRSLARHLSSRDPEKLFLEVLNEPSVANEQQWYKVQEKLLAAMREGAPQHTLIADSNNRIGDEIIEPDALMAITPLKDPNIIYNFHFYEPGVFTDQGAEWMEGMTNVKGLPYPYDAKVCRDLLAKTTDAAARDKIQYYCNGQWDNSKLEARLKKANEWGLKHNVRLTVNEFGVLYGGATENVRARWFTDVRTSFEKYGIGWTVWGYDDAYGIRHEENGKFVLDTDIVNALGLG